MKKFLLTLFFTINLFAGERIITLSPSINEIVFALTHGKNIVANTEYCNYPEESKKIPKVGGYANVSLEKMLIAKPTLVLAQDYDKELISNIKKLNLNVKTFKTNNLESIKKTILSIGTLLKNEEKAGELNKNIDDSLNSLKNIVSNKKILVVISPKKDLHRQIYVSGNHLYFEDILKASGNKNAFFSTSKAQPTVNVEKIIKMNPDVIVLLAPFFDGKPKELEELKDSWRKLPINASKSNYIYAVDKLYAGIPSQRVVYFIRDFKKILEDVRSKELQ